MALEIGPDIVAAFEQSVARRERDRFIAWWNARTAVLGAPLTLESAEALWRQAEEAALTIGIFDNDHDRLFVQAAALRLLPSPGGNQWLRATDAIFDDAPLDVRLERLAAIARSPD